MRDRTVYLDCPAPGSWRCGGNADDLLLRCDSLGLKTTLRQKGVVRKTWADPLAALDWMAKESDVLSEPFRWVGYLSYDLGRLFEETLSATAPDDLGLPLFCFSCVQHNGKRATLLDRHSDAIAPSRADVHALPPESNFTRRQYEEAVRRVIDYIAAGDIFQVNLSQRFSAPTIAEPIEIFHRLRSQFPAGYGALLEFDEFSLISNSPELFLHVAADRKIITRPIKGTRPRKPGMDIELRNSIKDQAELNMIVDLERNDLGRVCEIGSVRVVEPRIIEAHPTVYHGVATIEGRVRTNVSFVELLRATFPGGSITGAPKIRAMQIIEELEPVHRGPYCGAIGYLASDGTIELNVAIRTMIAKAGQVYIPVGGGIVADSIPSAEYDETLVKAQAMFAAIGLAPL